MPQTIAKPYSAVKKQENRTEMESFAAGKNIPADKTILKLHYDDNGALLSKTVEEAPSPWASFARAVPTALPANIAGAGAGVAIGGAGTAVGGPWVGIPAGFAAAGGTGMLVDKLINKGIEKVRPDWAEVLETDRRINPKASLAGSLISGAGAQKNLSIAGLKALAKSGGSAEKFGQLLKANPDIAALGGKSGDIVKGALTHVGTSAGLGVAQDLAMQKLSGRDDLDYTSALESGAIMPFIGGGRLRFGEKMAARPAEMIAERRAALAPRPKSQYGIDTDNNARHDAYVKYAELVSKAKPGEIPAILEDLKNTWGITASEKDLAAAADTITAARTKKLKEEAEKAKNTADKLSDSVKSGDLAANGLDPELVDHVKKSDLRDHGKPLTTEQAENLLLKPEFADIVAPYLESFKTKKAAEAAELKAKEDAKAAATPAATKTARDRLLEAKAAGKLISNELDPELVKHIQKSPLRLNGKTLTKEQAELMLSDPAFADDVAPHLESYVKKQQDALTPETTPVTEATTAVAPVEGTVGKSAESNPAQLQLQRLHSGELKNMTDFDSLEAAVNDGSLPVLYNPEGLEAEAAHFAVQKVISAVEKQEGMQPGDLTAADNKSVLAKGPFALGRNMNEAVLVARKLAYNLAKRVKDGNKNLIHTDNVDAVVAANKAHPERTAPVTAKTLEGDSTSAPVVPIEEAPAMTGQPVAAPKPTVPKPAAAAKIKGPTHNLVVGDKIVVGGREGEIVGFVTNSPNQARVSFGGNTKIVNVGKMRKPEAAPTVDAPAAPVEPPKTGQTVGEAPPAAVSPNTDMELRAKLGKLAEAHKAMADDASGTVDTMDVVDGMSNDLIDNHKLTPDQVALINRKIASELDSSGDVAKAVDAAVSSLQGGGSNTGKPFQPLPLRGNVGVGLGGVGDMARAVYNVTGRAVEGVRRTAEGINKGFREGDVQHFPVHIMARDGAKALFKLAGRAFNAATVRAGAGTGERLAATQGPSGSYVLDVTSPTFYRSERQYRNHFLEPIDDAGKLKLSSDQWKTIGQYADDIRELGASPINLTADERRGYDFIRESYDRSRIAQISAGKLINGRAANLTADFVPRTVMNQKIRNILNGPDSPERSHYIDLYRNWAKHQDPRLTQGQIDNMLADVLGKDPFGGKRNPTFAPLEQAEGIGLPPEMREDNALTVAKYYAIRSATGLAWHKAVETDPIAARIFGKLPAADAEKNTVGYDTPEILPSHTNANDYLVTGYGPAEYARNLTGDPYLEAYRQDMAMGSHQNYDWVDNMTAVVNGFKLGPKTAMRDVVSSLLGSQLEIAHISEVPKLLKAVSDVYYGRSTAVKAGAVKRSSAAEFAIEESLRKTAGRIADVMRKYQGRDLMEKGVREILFEYGRGIAESRYLQNDTEFLENYGSKQWKKFDVKDHNDLLDRMATKFVEQLQGSYSPDYLPKSLTRGAGPSWTKATLSLSRWGIERFRRYRQTVVEPLAKGDARPFLRSTAAYLGLAAPAVYALEELLTEKKPLYMTNGEFFNLLNDDGTPSKAKMDEFAYTVLGRAQLVGMAGIFTGALYQMMQARHGEHTSGFNNPGWGAVEDMGARIGQYWNAYSGSDFFTHLHELPYETLMNETQSLRLLRGAMDNKEDSGDREEQIYKRVTGQTKFKVGSAYRSDPFNPVSKMKKAETVGDIMDQEEPLTRMYESAPPQEPANFPRRIRHDFGYYNFLDKIQGDGAGEAQLQKDMSGQVFNPIRSMVAKKAFIKAKARNLADELAP